MRVTANADCRVANNNQCRVPNDSRCQSVGQVQGFALQGVNMSCLSLVSSVTSGAHFVTSLPAPDQNGGLTGIHDLNVGITFVGQ